MNVQVSRLKYIYFFFISKINYIATNKLLGNIKCMVSFMNYKLNLGDGKKTWHRTRLAQISLIHVFQGSYHAFCFFLLHYITIYASTGLFSTYFTAYLQLSPWNHGIKDKKIWRHNAFENRINAQGYIFGHWPNISLFYWVIFMQSIKEVRLLDKMFPSFLYLM